MHSTTYYLELLRTFKREHAAEYGITQLGIFGSVARGEHKENSDVDVYFESDNIGLLAMGGLMYNLQELFGVPVSLVHKHQLLNPTFLQHIKKEMIYV